MRIPARAWKVAQAILGLLVLFLAIRTLVKNWDSFRTQEIAWDFSFGWLLASGVIVLAMYTILIEAWRRVLRAMGQPLAFWAAARVWVLASLGKYLPGKVWALAGAAVLAQRAGVDPAAAVAAALVLQALAFTSGVAAVVLVAPGLLATTGSVMAVAGGVLLVLTIAALVTLSSPRAMHLLRRFVPSGWPRPRPVPPGALIGAFLANCVAWAGYGIAFVCLSRGIMREAVLPVQLAVGAFAGSYLVGLVAVFAPGGLGPRESVLFLALQPLGPRAAVGLVIASRLLLTLTELGAAIPFLLTRRKADQPRPT